MPSTCTDRTPSLTRRGSWHASSPTAPSARLSGADWFPRATTCRPFPTRSPPAGPTSTPPPSRTTSTGTGSRPSIGWATRATARTSRTSRPAARSRTPATYRSRLPCSPRLHHRGPVVASKSTGTRRSIPPRSRASSCSGPPRRRLPAGVRHPRRERLHRLVRTARRRLPLLHSVDRPHRLLVPTLGTGPAPVLTH